MTDQREQEMQNRIDGLLLEKENLNHEVGYLKEQLAQLKEMAFGCRTEKTTQVLGDPAELNLFNEAEIEARGNAPEPVIDVPAHQRHKKQKGHLEQLPGNCPMRNVSLRCRKMRASVNVAVDRLPPWARKRSAQRCSSFRLR